MTDLVKISRFYDTNRTTPVWRIEVGDSSLWLEDDEMAVLADHIYKAREAGEI